MTRPPPHNAAQAFDPGPEDKRALVREPPPPRLVLRYFGDIALFDSGGGLIDGILQPGGLSVIYGEAGSRKTFLAVDIGFAVARGTPWRDRDTQQAAVVYVAAEAGRSFDNRLVAYRAHHGLEDATIPFAAITEPVDLGGDPGDVAALIGRINEAGKHFEAPVGLVEIDTLSRVLAGGDENNSADMGRLVANLDRIRTETGAHVCGIHHTGKDSSRGARGHSLLRAAVDTEIETIADGAAAFSTANVRKQRDLPTTGAFAFGLDMVELGIGRNGKPITSCVVRHLDDAARPAARPRKLTDKQLLALDTLRNVLTDHGTPAPSGPHYPAGAIVAPVDLWRENLIARGVLDREAANPREDFRRLRTGLAERGAVAEWNNSIWAVEARKA